MTEFSKLDKVEHKLNYILYNDITVDINSPLSHILKFTTHESRESIRQLSMALLHGKDQIK